MLRPGDDAVLQFLAQVGEVGIVTGYFYHQVCILLGLLLCCSQRLGGGDVQLHVEYPLIDERPDQIGHGLYTVSVSENTRVYSGRKR